MPSSQDITADVASSLLARKDLTLVKCEPLQTLWAGYGHICSVQAIPNDTPTAKPSRLILKCISPPLKPGKRQDEGHLRKMISYQVEQHFYAHLAPQMPASVAVAPCLASIDAHDGTKNITAMILSDLREQFPVAGEKRGVLNQTQIEAAVDWLAGFHGFWWTRTPTLDRKALRRPPLEEARRVPVNGSAVDTGAALQVGGGVWLNGGYTYLATRRSEYADLKSANPSLWSDKLCTPIDPSQRETLAERVARFLSPSPDPASPGPISPYETLIHGDVKSENLFTTTAGDAVAFFDFQYVGLGLGVCDLAKLFTCSLPEDLLAEGAADGAMHNGEERLLRRYLEKIEVVSGKCYGWETFVRHWETALVDWLRFQASWGFWGNTEWLEARVERIVDDDGWRGWLDRAVGVV